LYYHEPRDSNNSWGPEFNYEDYDENLNIKPAWKFVGDNVRFWIEEYHIDGIRYDAARQIENYDFMHWVVQETKKVAGSKPFYNIAEHIPETTSITNVEGPMDGCWHASFYHTIRDHLLGDRFDLEDLKDVIDAKRQGFLGVTNVVNYISCHDHERLMVELGNNDIFGETAFKRIKLGVALLMTAVGVPMIWMGEEFGDYHPLDLSSTKIDWQLLQNDENNNLWYYYKGLIQLRKTNHALQTTNIDFFHEDPDSKVIAYTRWNNNGSQVVVIANFSNHYYGGYEVSHFPAQGTWHEWTGDYDIKSGNQHILLDLAEYEAKVLVWKNQ
jgi:1,4-alpha-glucan branching enzyme